MSAWVRVREMVCENEREGGWEERKERKVRERVRVRVRVRVWDRVIISERERVCVSETDRIWVIEREEERENMVEHERVRVRGIERMSAMLLKLYGLHANSSQAKSADLYQLFLIRWLFHLVLGHTTQTTQSFKYI